MGRHFLAFLLAVSLFDPERALDDISGKAVIVDGDTIEISETRIRLHGIDAPEAGQNCKTETGSSWDCGKRAIQVLAELVENKDVRCKQHENDEHGHAIATCYVGDLNLGAEMIRRCLAWAFLKSSTDYLDLEYRTASGRCGIWDGVNVRPWKLREKRWQAEAQISPNGCPIKGNISKDKGEKIYHMPWSPAYDTTSINEDEGERWFCSEKDAIDNGWRAPRWH